MSHQGTCQKRGVKKHHHHVERQSRKSFRKNCRKSKITHKELGGAHNRKKKADWKQKRKCVKKTKKSKHTLDEQDWSYVQIEHWVLLYIQLDTIMCILYLSHETQSEVWHFYELKSGCAMSCRWCRHMQKIVTDQEIKNQFPLWGDGEQQTYNPKQGYCLILFAFSKLGVPWRKFNK